MQNLPLLLTIPQVAEQLNTSRRFVDSLVSAGELPSLKIKGARRVQRDVLLAFIADIAASGPVTDADIDVTLAAGEISEADARFLRAIATA